MYPVFPWTGSNGLGENGEFVSRPIGHAGGSLQEFDSGFNESDDWTSKNFEHCILYGSIFKSNV